MTSQNKDTRSFWAKMRQRGTCPRCGRKNLYVCIGVGPDAQGKDCVKAHKAKKGDEFWCWGGIAEDIHSQEGVSYDK